MPVPLAPLRESSAGDPRARTRSPSRARCWSVLRAPGPAVAVLEDAHWADPATLDVLRLLARRVEDAGVVVLVTYRDDELAANPALAMLVGDLVTSPAARRMALAPALARRGARARRAAGVDPAELTRLTGGNPFLVVEALAARDGLPSSVRDATLARVGRLGPEARGVVDAAAVIGQRVPPDLLAVDRPRHADAVEEALARGVLTDDGAALGFRHELTRQAIEDAISAPRRAALHARVVAALEQRAPEHAQAGPPRRARRPRRRRDPLRRARRRRRRARRRAARGRAPARTARCGSARSCPPPSGSICSCASRARRTSRAAWRPRSTPPRRRSRWRPTPGRAGAHSTCWPRPCGRSTASRRRATPRPRRSWRSSRQTDLAELARAHAAYVRVEAVAFDPAAAIAAAARALELAARAGAEEARVDATISLAVAHGYRGEPAVGTRPRAPTRRRPACTSRSSAPTSTSWRSRRTPATTRRSTRSRPRRSRASRSAGSPRPLSTYRCCRRAASSTAAAGTRRSSAPRPAGAAGTAACRSRTWWTGSSPPGAGRTGARGCAEAGAVLADVPEGARHGLIQAALAEAAWLRRRPRGRARARAGGVARARTPDSSRARPASSRCGPPARAGGPVAPSACSTPVRLELAGDWRGAIAAWRALHAPYEAALAALPGDDRAAREAVAALQRLGATAAARAFARDRAERGAAALRGPRRSTLANAAGLTRREQEVLEHVAAGATNADIARALHLSERTVEHHVSAILGKLGATTRTGAVTAARGAGLNVGGAPAKLGDRPDPAPQRRRTVASRHPSRRKEQACRWPRTGTAPVQGELWSARADDWAASTSPTWRPAYEAVLDLVHAGPGVSILEVGCGSGTALRFAADRGANVTALDAAPAFVEHARRRVPARRRPRRRPPVPALRGREFDVVIGFNSFQYAADPIAALAEARRVLRPGGRVPRSCGAQPRSASSRRT